MFSLLIPAKEPSSREERGLMGQHAGLFSFPLITRGEGRGGEKEEVKRQAA